MIPIDQVGSLALFARVVHHRSFSAAAREVGLAKSAVSRRIAELERALGVRLLHRTTRTLSLTEEGVRVHEHARDLVSAADSAQQVAGLATGAVRGTLRLNATAAFAQLYLVRALAEFLVLHPEVEVQLSTDNRLVDVVEGGFDVVFRIGRLTDSSLVARRLATDRLVICASPEYLARAGVPRSPSELVGHACLHYLLVPRSAEWRFRQGARNVEVSTRGPFSCDDGLALRQALLMGAGLGRVPSMLVAEDVAAGRLQVVLEGTRPVEFGVHALTAHRTHVPPRVRALLDFLVTHFRTHGPRHIPPHPK
ncbi:MAG TPA: LysR family transcriptional regulator [Myxococcaceae bacterium]|nr:LysR family transcriptional regulator [Myxococcaceae bacterium]